MKDVTLTVDSYWQMLSHLSKEVKLRLIAKLSESLLEPSVKEKSHLADMFYGAWEDSISAEDMVDRIRESRNFNRTVENL